ncbi:MAG: DNA cytosine methyltransferase [Pirellulaceae bacterium]
MMADRLRVLKLFAGVGGGAVAISDKANIVAAVETDEGALAIYRHNFSHPIRNQAVRSLPPE